MKDELRKIHELKETMREYCEDRDWDQFHNAKDLAIGIVTEASEILEHFRFKSPSEVDKMLQNPEKKEAVEDEMADVLSFLVRMAQKYDMDLAEAFDRKLEKNRQKYPIDKCKGSNRKYTEFE